MYKCRKCGRSFDKPYSNEDEIGVLRDWCPYCCSSDFYNLEDTLQPYANNPLPAQTSSKLISRLPMLVDANGSINKEFNGFYEIIVRAIVNQQWEVLYQLSDKFLAEADFCSLINKAWVKHFEEYNSVGLDGKSIDIEINMDRFKTVHRNIIGGFNIMTYHLNLKDDDFSLNGEHMTQLKQATTEILFTYSKSNGFVIISNFKPFTIIEDS